MPSKPPESASETLRKILSSGDLPYRDFMAWALYDRLFGYYVKRKKIIGKHADFVTSPTLSGAFSYALGRLGTEFVERAGDALCAIVDIGSGGGELIRGVAAEVGDRALFFGVDRSYEVVGRRPPADPGGGNLVGRRAPHVPRGNEGRLAADAPPITFTPDLASLPTHHPTLILSNELFDAFPVARLVRREGGLRELCVTLRDDQLDWSEREAPEEYVRYFADRGIELQVGQFADVTPEWSSFHEGLFSRFERCLVVSIDYGFEERKLFDPRIRRFGTAAAFHRQQFNRDLLARPGEQDLTAHINFDDLIRAGERSGAQTLFFGRQATFLLALGITSHPLFTPSHELAYEGLEDAVADSEERQAARRLVLPEGIGEEMRVLVQGRGVDPAGWSFQRKLF
jgi:SAM-dependent MidA family methyltransferase